MEEHRVDLDHEGEGGVGDVLVVHHRDGEADDHEGVVDQQLVGRPFPAQGLPSNIFSHLMQKETFKYYEKGFRLWFTYMYNVHRLFLFVSKGKYLVKLEYFKKIL